MTAPQTARTPERGNKALLIVTTLIALWFLNSFAFQYLTVDRDRFGIYWSRHQWLYVHVIGGMTALLLGPLQFWLGLNRREKILHRILGGAYVLAVFISGTAAFNLAWNTDFGWVFGLGMTEMAVAWMVSTTLATVAILRHLVEQHREWMIRSYTLTFGFVTFRMFTEIMQVAGVGTTLEQMTAASWFSWSVPLMITEFAIQGRKILRGGAVQRITFLEQHHLVPKTDSGVRTESIADLQKSM
jgi:hypothetical protein